MELRYTGSDEDVLNSFRVRSKQPWTMFLICAAAGADVLGRDFRVTHDLAMIGWIWLALSAGIGTAVYEVPRPQIRRSMRGDPSSQGEIVLLLNDDGTEFTYAPGKAQLQWRAYTKYKETQHSFVLLHVFHWIRNYS
jgi:hypothetical protein